MITPMDIIVIFVTVFSGVLAILRGFFREILSLISWVGAAILAYYFYELFIPFAEKYISHPTIALISCVVFVFFISLFLLFMLTMKLAELINQSVIGPLDRTLGLIFGFIRGILIAAFAILLITNMTKPSNRGSWFNNAKTLPMLEYIANRSLSILPSDFSSFFEYADQIGHKKAFPSEEE